MLKVIEVIGVVVTNFTHILPNCIVDTWCLVAWYQPYSLSLITGRSFCGLLILTVALPLIKSLSGAQVSQDLSGALYKFYIGQDNIIVILEDNMVPLVTGQGTAQVCGSCYREDSA